MKIKSIGKISTDADLKICLENERTIPVKFCYPEDGGNKWHELRRDTNYATGKRELTALIGSIIDIKTIVSSEPINIVHLGPGDGIEIPILFETFKPNGNGKYAGIDISEQMIYNTVNLNKEYFSKISYLWYLTDIETEGNLNLICKDVKSKGITRNLIFCTNQGALLSNPTTLEYLCSAMQKQDYLFITIEGDSPDRRDEICATYNLPAVRNILAVGLTRAGYSAENGIFRTIFNEQKHQVEVYFKPEKESELLCLTSYKPKEDEFKERLIKAGFGIEYFKFYEEVHTFAVLCTRR